VASPEPKSNRHIAFVERVLAGEGYGEAWTSSAHDVGVKPGSQAANNVSGSRLASKYADYLATEKTRRASCVTKAPPVTAESVGDLMQEITETLVRAADAASKAGSQSTATSIRRLISTHVGRVHRATAGAEKEPDAPPAFDFDSALQRLHWCVCDA